MARSTLGMSHSWRWAAIGTLLAIAWLSGAVNFGAIDWVKTLLSLVFSILVTILLAIVTEEGVFRGWLWASLQRAGVTERGLLVWTSVAFAAWHISTALLPTDFHPPLAQVPIYLLNAAVIGLNWGLMRQRSGSIVVTSVSHGLWNGLVGLALNVAFAAVLWLGFSRGRAIKAGENGAAPGPSS